MFTDVWPFLATALVGFSVVCYFMVILMNTSKRRKWITGKTILLVTAHPDDECLFFGPTLRGFIKSAENVYVLCLSAGDHYGQKRTRKSELRRSCELMGIPSSNVTVVEHTLMPDDPMRCWRKDLIATVVLKHITALSVDTVISFDFYGISGHLNHISIFSGLRHLRSKDYVPKNCKFYLLESVSVFRKYSGILDMPLSYMTSRLAYVSSVYDILTLYRAAYAHRSQMLWFRYLYVIFSRYMIINTFRELKPYQSSHKIVNGEKVNKTEQDLSI